MKFRKREEGKKEGRKEGRKEGLRLTRSLTHPSLFARSTQSGLQGRSSPASTLKQAWSDGRSFCISSLSLSAAAAAADHFPLFTSGGTRGSRPSLPSVYLVTVVTERRPTTVSFSSSSAATVTFIHSLGVTAPAAGWEGEEGKALEKAEQNCKTPNLD